jgi:shikimate dehydrogenase
MQNAAFEAAGLDWVYVPLPVAGTRLAEAVAGLVALGAAGANVTIPHKTAVLAFCDAIDAVAERAGSVNTLVVRDGRVHGSSTDGLAVVESVECAGEHVLLLGAGGAAQAVATALADAGAAAIAIWSRTPERAHALAARLRSQFPDREIGALDGPPSGDVAATLVVNATPIRDEVVVELGPERQVVDLAYRADGSETALVTAARAAESRAVVDGLEVLVRQGAASFERWTGMPAPLDAMRAALRPG